MKLSPALKQAFEKAVETGTPESFEDLVELTHHTLNPYVVEDWRKAGQSKGWGVEQFLALQLTLCRIALIEPALTLSSFDRLSLAWLEGSVALDQPFKEAAHAPATLWQLFWEDVEAAPLRVEPARAKAFLEALDPKVKKAFEEEFMRGKGVEEALKTGYVRPAGLSLESLAHYPVGSLGEAFYHYLVDNKLELEIVKDRPYQLFEDERANFIAQRLYHTHDLWHVLLGYSVSGIDEISLAAFGVGQVTSFASIRLLALILSRALFKDFYGLATLLNALFKGYRHGRQTSGLIGVEWEELLAEPLSDLRTRYQLQVLSDL